MEFAPFTVQNMPEFEAMADDGLAAGLDDAGADEQVLFAEFGIVHTSGVGCEIVGFVADLPGQVGIGGLHRMEGGDEFRDLAFIEPGGRSRCSGVWYRWNKAGVPGPQLMACVE